LKRTTEARVFRRAQAVRAVVTGHRLQPVSDTLPLTYAALRTWVHRFATEGTRGLVARPRSGRPPTITCALEQLSLSRLNHGQPGVQAHPEIVQGTAELHHEIADALLPQADPVFHNTTTLDAAVDMLDPQPSLVERLVGQVLLQGELRTAWLLRRHEDLHLGERERQEAQILQQPTPSREWGGGGLRNAQIMHTAAIGIAQKEDREEGIHEQDIFDGVVFLVVCDGAMETSTMMG
jgi:transposase